MSDAQSSDAMIKLIKFLVCLAVLGIVIALVIYFTVVLPHAAAPQVPTNYLYPGGPSPRIDPDFVVT